MEPLILCTLGFVDATISLERGVIAISSHDLLKSQRVSSSDIDNLPIGIAEIAGKRL